MTLPSTTVKVWSKLQHVLHDQEKENPAMATGETVHNISRHSRDVDDVPGCQEPTEEELQELLNADAIDRAHRVEELNPEQEYERLMTSIGRLDRSNVQCHLLHAPVLQLLPLNRVTTCPWVEVEDFNPNR